MKIQRCKIFGCLLLTAAIAVSTGFALPDANADFGKTITTAQMANMFGGGFVTCGDTDCDTESGSCPGGNTCDSDGTPCYNCKNGAGQTCGAPGGWGWQCVATTESCDDTVGMCSYGNCREITVPGAPSCGTKPDC